MKAVDPDVIAVLTQLVVDADTPRVLQAHKRHDEATKRRFETQLELLRDDLEAVIPKDSPLFELVLVLAVARKIENKQQEPEFHSALEFPNNW